MSMDDLIKGTLGLCNRAGKISTGSTLIEDIRKNKVYFVIIASDASDNTKKKISDKCKFYNVEFIEKYHSEEISAAIGKNNRMAVGIMDKGFYAKIKKEMGR